jgi:hypothetical protein
MTATDGNLVDGQMFGIDMFAKSVNKNTTFKLETLKYYKYNWKTGEYIGRA